MSVNIASWPALKPQVRSGECLGPDSAIMIKLFEGLMNLRMGLPTCSAPEIYRDQFMRFCHSVRRNAVLQGAERVSLTKLISYRLDGLA